MSQWRPGRLKHWLSLNESGLWGDEPDGENDVEVLRSTDITLDGQWRIDEPAVRSVPALDRHRKVLREGDLVVVTSSGSEAHLGKTAIVDAGVAARSACFANFVQRLRPAHGADARYIRYFLGSTQAKEELAALGNTTTGLRNLNGALIGSVTFPGPSLVEQQEIADYLDAETGRIDALIAHKQQLIGLLEERIDAAIMEFVGRSEIVVTGWEPSVEIRQVLEKLERTPVGDEMITAFRDGQVTTRAARGKDGFTNSWTDSARVQGVEVGDVIVHGLDGFSGAIGDSEANGVCSPVYHVCQPKGGGDPAFYGRLLRRLALTGYLGNFAVSTRERAVDFRNWDLFGRIPIPLVPVEQQRKIGDRIRTLRPLVEVVQRSEALAAERKSVLISRAVAGGYGSSASSRPNLAGYDPSPPRT